MIASIFNKRYLRSLVLPVLLLLGGVRALAGEKDFPDKPVPARLVNDFAHILSPSEEARLEHKLEGFARTTSTQITVVTITSLGDYEVGDYTIKLFNKWQIGQEGKNNGVMLLVSMNEHKSFISVGKGLEGVLTDAQSSRVLRNELKPAFKQHEYAEGLERATEAIIAVTKDEYKADKNISNGDVPVTAIIVIIIIIVIILKITGRGGGGGGGYVSRRGMGDFATGWLIGNLLSGGSRGGSGWGGGGGDWGGGGFGGFGGGSTGGGGASGDW